MHQPVIGSAGELLVEFVAADRNGRHLKPTSYAGPFPSGAPGIFIDQAGRLGARALFAGAVGNDAFGKVILDRLGRDGVSTALVPRIQGVPTGSAFVSYNDDGGRDFVFNIAHSAAARLGEPKDLANAMLGSGIEIFHVSGSSLGDPAMAARLFALARRLHERGVKLSLDPNIRKELLGDPAYRRTVEALTERASFFLPSEEDAAILFPGETFESWASRLIGAGADIVVLKRGDRGARGLTRQAEDIDLSAFAVPVADPTGAGDCFCATLVTLSAAGMPFAEALRRANAAGAVAVGKLGPMEGNSSLAEIDAFLASRLELQQ
jgi:sugar/nucleoside kinase (ribokinase family)